ncbi:MAG TPA: Stp1/IreP family PP2C-type Ser/Thr phosphatase [Actinomycetota bacterium]|nr:Stp1/IreP family PP2C-type Ser/Thr phosphatase [Actinomycetota bacterium]
MRARIGEATDVGLVRERNEDGYLVRPPLFAVADGMGGHRGGEVASRLALETLERPTEAPLAERIREANRVVYERSIIDRSVAGMGTTLTAAVLEGDRLRLAHVGDSRAYLLREGRLERLTEDHTMVRRMVEEGRLTEQEAAWHPYRSVLTRALGTEPDVPVDEAVVEVRPGDRVLLCTDGLTSMLEEERIAELLRTTPDPQAAADRLVEEALAAGGLDNVTVLVLDLEEDPGGGGRSPGLERGKGGGRRLRLPRTAVRRAAVGLLVALALGGLAAAGLRAYLDRQWYVGISHGNVAVFRGVPTSVAGFALHRLVFETDIPAREALELAYYRDLPTGITARDREAAMAIVDQIREDLAARDRATEGAA